MVGITHLFRKIIKCLVRETNLNFLRRPDPIYFIRAFLIHGTAKKVGDFNAKIVTLKSKTTMKKSN